MSKIEINLIVRDHNGKNAPRFRVRTIGKDYAEALQTAVTQMDTILNGEKSINDSEAPPETSEADQ